MKKFAALLLVAVMALGFAGCADVHEKSEGVMTHAEYMAADFDTEVTVEAFVTGKQSWWQDAATVYAQDKDGGYLFYNMSCTEAEYEKLEVGTKIKVTGIKAEFNGEIEIAEGKAEILTGKWEPKAKDVTDILAKDELIDNQNMLVSFKGMTVEASKDANGNEAPFLYGWDGSGAEGTDADLYFNASVDGNTYTFTVEYYLCNEETDVYKAVQGLKVGDTIDMEGFLYWYEGVNPHITSVKVK